MDAVEEGAELGSASWSPDGKRVAFVRYTITNSPPKIDVIDATPQSPPLDIDDPGVPDQGEFEINLLTAADFSDDLRRIEMLRVDANYGVVLKSFGHELPTQLKFEIPIAAARAGGNPYEIGMGRAAFGLKFNFYNDENRGLRLSIYPQLEFATSGSAEKDLAEKGQTIVVPLLLSKESKLMTLVANATIEKPVHDADRDAHHVEAAQDTEAISPRNVAALVVFGAVQLRYLLVERVN